MAMREAMVYLHADRAVIARRSDVPEEFMRKECAVYSILVRYLTKCSIDTGRLRPIEASAGVLRCLDIA